MIFHVIHKILGCVNLYLISIWIQNSLSILEVILALKLAGLLNDMTSRLRSRVAFLTQTTPQRGLSTTSYVKSAQNFSREGHTSRPEEICAQYFDFNDIGGELWDH